MFKSLRQTHPSTSLSVQGAFGARPWRQTPVLGAYCPRIEYEKITITTNIGRYTYISGVPFLVALVIFIV